MDKIGRLQVQSSVLLTQPFLARISVVKTVNVQLDSLKRLTQLMTSLLLGPPSMVTDLLQLLQVGAIPAMLDSCQT